MLYKKLLQNAVVSAAIGFLRGEGILPLTEDVFYAFLEGAAPKTSHEMPLKWEARLGRVYHWSLSDGSRTRGDDT